MHDPRGQFESVRAMAATLTRTDEVCLLNFLGEDSDFVRLSRGRMRQAGHVLHSELRVRLIRGRRQTQGACTLTHDLTHNRSRLEKLFSELRLQLDFVHDDPYLLYATAVCSTEDNRHFDLPDSEHALTEILAAADGLDLVGLWANGTLYRGFANSLGQTNWFSTGSFHLDSSCHVDNGQSVKLGYAGQAWQSEDLRRAVGRVREHLEVLYRPPKALAPGRYRAFLAPQALGEILGLLGWGGFSLKSLRTQHTPLIKLMRHEKALHPSVTLVEEHARGLNPQFTSSGFLKPRAVSLIESGRFVDCLADQRSAAEYRIALNTESETPMSLVMESGRLPMSLDLLEELETGLYVGNLWYCNFSDRYDCRVTATTRFACFWVEGGALQAPITTMRMDETLYHLLGDGLIGLTAERELIIDPGTYEWRSTASMLLSGALIDGVTFTM
ncbi:MAG: metallopeptidase TldD-related protein [Gammaproteobacteria bacterium]